MTNRKYSCAVFALTLALLLLLSLGAPLAAAETEPVAFEAIPEAAEVSVSTIDELLSALAPHTVIYLEPGEYDLSTASDYGRSYRDGCYTWNEAYDGYELVIRGLDGLRLVGLPGTAEVVLSAVPRYAEVLRFESCRDLTLSGFTAGHTREPGECAGGVLEFDSCADVKVLSCKLYGCGVMGVTAVNCDTVEVDSCAVYQCTNGAVWARGVRDFRLVNSEVYDCPGRSGMESYALFDVQTSSGFAVVNCTVRDNNATALLRCTTADEVYFLGTEVKGNRFGVMFSSNLIPPTVAGCAFTANSVSGQTLEGIDALLTTAGERIGGDALQSMTLERQDYAGPKLPETPTVTGIPAQDGMEFHVTTVDELLACIASDTTIYLDAETFRLSDASNYGGYGGEHYYWLDLYDGPGLVITGVQNLRLIGQGKEQTTLLAEPRYADVISFQSCEHVTVAQLTAGHTTEPEYCMGNVLGFDSCRDIHVVDCGLFGCGVWGISASNSVQGDILRTEIYECSEGAVTLYCTTGFVFTDCLVRDCAGRDWNTAEEKTAHNYMLLNDCGDISYNGTAMRDGLTVVGEENFGARPWEEPVVTAPEEYLHLYYYNIDISQGFTLSVGDEVLLDVVPSANREGTDFAWGVSDAGRLSLSVSESGCSCTLKALKAAPDGVMLSIWYGDIGLNVPVYIR